MALKKLTKEEITKLGIQPENRAQETNIQSSNILETLSTTLDAVFGGKKIGEAIGAQIARQTVPKEQKEFIDTPEAKEVVADVARAGLIFTPIGRIASGVAKIANPFTGRAIGKLAGNISAGGVTGLGFDIAESVRNREEFKPIGAVLGGGIPLGGAGLKQGIRAFGILNRELAGVSTGAGGESVQQLFNASRQGGKSAKAALDSLRGKISEDVIVNDARIGLENVINRRNQQFKVRFKEIINNKQNLDVSPINRKVDEMLKDFRIKKTAEGVLDFSQSPLKFNKSAQTEIQTIVDEMTDFGLQKGDRTPEGVDTLKRALDDIYSESSQARAFTAAIRNTTRKVLSKVDKYDVMEKEYEEATRFIKELAKSLSLKDQTATETAFKKLTSSLRVNNEIRAEFLKQLDQESGRFISAQIAGQQLNELLPRGILRAFGVAGAGIATLFGGTGLLPFLQAAALTSPRAIGEITRVLGIGARQTDKIIQALQKTLPKGQRTPGDILLSKVGR